LQDLARRYLGEEVVLFTTDGDSEQLMRCGKTPGVYATIDFGTTRNANASFQVQRLFEPKGPLVNSEFYPGTLIELISKHKENVTYFFNRLVGLLGSSS